MPLVDRKRLHHSLTPFSRPFASESNVCGELAFYGAVPVVDCKGLHHLRTSRDALFRLSDRALPTRVRLRAACSLLVSYRPLAQGHRTRTLL